MTNFKLNRRQALLGAGALGAAVFANKAWAQALSGEDRPNFLSIVSEDNSPRWIGAYGNPVAHTPNIDALAARGVLFQHNYATAPVCAPSRFALITGTHAESSMPGINMRALPPNGFANMPDFIIGWPTYLREIGYYTTNNAKTDYNAEIDMGATWDESSNEAHYNKRPDGAPFFAIFNYSTTHESNESNYTPDDLITDPQAVDVPAYLPDRIEVREDIAHLYDNHRRYDEQVAERIAELEASGEAENTIIFLYGDHGGLMPRSKRFVFDSGLRTPLIVVFPEKWQHLAPAEPGGVIESPVSLIDIPPTVLSMVGITPPDYMQGVAWAGEIAGEPRQYAFSGRNRMDERNDLSRTVTDGRFRYIRNYMPHRIYMQYQSSARSARSMQLWEQMYEDGELNEVQARLWQDKAPEEMYDLHNDPDEVVNLIGDPTHEEKYRELYAALDQHMIDIWDGGFIPEGSSQEGWEPSREPGAYPLENVIELANVGVERDAANIDILVRALSHENEVMRWWGAEGLLMLKEGAGPAADALLDALQNDPSEFVRIEAAAALSFLGHEEVGVPYLGGLVDSDAAYAVRLAAINALAVVPLEAAELALPQIDTALGEGSEHFDDNPGRESHNYVGRLARYLSAKIHGYYRIENIISLRPGP